MFAVFATAAHAAEPVADVHATATAQRGPFAFGGGGALGLHLGRADVELAVDGAFGDDPLAFGGPQLRLLARKPRETGPHAIIGAGVLFAEEGAREVLRGGIGLDVGRSAWRPRVQAALLGWPGDAPWRAVLSVGLVGRPKPRVEPVAEPAQPPRFDADWVWVPGPVCEWLPAQQASAVFLQTRADPWTTPVVAAPAPKRPIEDALGPRGQLVVAAAQGDHVEINGQPLTLAADGVGWLEVAEGPVDVRVTGGGRVVDERVAVAADTTLWFDAPREVASLLISFGVGSDRLDADGEQSLAAYAKLAGGWTFDVWGSFSPEGDVAANLDLADRRARAVVDALAARGVPADRLVLATARPPEPGRDPAEQRSAVIAPRVQE